MSRREHRNSMPMMCHYSDLGVASDRPKQIFLPRSIIGSDMSPVEIRISVLVLGIHFAGKPAVASQNVA